MHKGLVNRLLSDLIQVRNMNKPTSKEIEKAEEDACEAVKATLIISRAKKHQYGKLKDELVNNHLLGTDQYPSTFKNAICILSNYLVTKAGSVQVEAEEEATQVTSWGHCKEIPPGQTAGEIPTVTTVDEQIIGCMSAHSCPESNSNSST